MRRSAFTIIELLVVLVIISTLVGIVAVSGTNIRKSSRDAERLSEVILIGKAIDTYANTNHGLYPRNKASIPDAVYTDVDSKMCAEEIGGIDKTIFPHREIPEDPQAAQLLHVGCTSMLNGYTYHRFTVGFPSLARTTSTKYVLEVGLEKEKPSDEALFKSPTDFTGITPVPSIERPFRYLLLGPKN